MDRLSLFRTILLVYGLVCINDAYSEKTLKINIQASPKTTTPASNATTTPATTNTTTPASNATTTPATTNTTTPASNATTTPATTNTTTPASNATTTPATTNTTTPASNATTTPATTNTTTPASNATTTHATTNTTTAASSTTTIHSTPTPTLEPKPSPPETGNYIVGNEQEVCIKAMMGLELELTNSSKTQQYFNIIPTKTGFNGTCAKSTANLNLTFANGFINFVFTQDEHYYYLDGVNVSFLTQSESWRGTASNQKLLQTEKGYSVKCKNTPKIQLGDTINLVMTNVTLQAFNIKDKDFGKETSCKYDRNYGPMIAGIVIVVIVVLGIIIYFIWHKKKSSGYQRI
ncbi:lysosome-associated membrane glycoprotein 3 isoform X2 [Xenopus laevis]|uniref:Lysosome-associated membrane glycoprotein 3 isoform X2 n=2 Tax=Xenopus laevis TaxID=8355 RepID=A0A8J0VD24_XENLA|nr:lysosome-associated membrane glycoprotein 3 isoform X2 [Xenopus laevis]